IRKKTASLTSTERALLVTLIAAMSLSGQFVPPMLVFPRKDRNNQLLRGISPGAIYVVHPTG
ncbi:hypothetical protein ILUMI_15860, partial [Ignelater luminosus]